MAEETPQTPTEPEPKPELSEIPKLGDVNPRLRELQRIDPLGFAEEVVEEAKPEIIEEVIADNPDGDMDELNDAVQDTLHRTEIGVGFMALRAAAEAKKAAYLETDDMYHSFPVEEMRRVLAEEGFHKVYTEVVVDDDEILHEGQHYPRPDGVFEIWFNPEGTLVTFDALPEMDYSMDEPVLLGHVVNGASLRYNWLPDPGTFVYYSDHGDEVAPEWKAHVDAHHWSNFTSSGHFLTVSDEEWEDPENRVWVGEHHFVEGGLRYALHNLRRNGRFLPTWHEAPGTTEFRHYGDSRRTADYRYKDHPEALVAARDQVKMQIRARYEALPDEVKACIGHFHTWETKRDLKPDPSPASELPSLDYLTEEPSSPAGPEGPEI